MKFNATKAINYLSKKFDFYFSNQFIVTCKNKHYEEGKFCSECGEKNIKKKNPDFVGVVTEFAKSINDLKIDDESPLKQFLELQYKLKKEHGWLFNDSWDYWVFCKNCHLLYRDSYYCPDCGKKTLKLDKNQSYKYQLREAVIHGFK